MSNLRGAPTDLTPARVERLVAFLEGAGRPARARDGSYPFLDHRSVAQLAATHPIPLDASVAASGRTTGDVQLPPVAAEEAGRDANAGAMA
jgi:hypothetical protein